MPADDMVSADSDGTRRRRSRRSRRLRPLARPLERRADLQGMRAVAVLAVFAEHLFGWPSGGFVGVDVFFVLSGFFITALLVQERAAKGKLSFKNFYIRRVKRILPSALLVLLVTVIGAYVVFPATRAKATLVDALYASVFAANFRFEAVGADYFQQDQPPSPLQHFWSLSIEEQFYFVWPSVIVLIFTLTRKAQRKGTQTARQSGLFGAMAVVVVASFVWAMLLSGNDANRAYFSTFTRIWELGVGALVAIAAPWLTRLPESVRPVLAYLGLAGVASSLFLIDSTVRFPAPWAALPVLSTALVVAAFCGAPVRGMSPLTNSVAGYIGDTSYTLYLWHWPVIMLLLGVMDKGPVFYVLAIVLSFGLTAATYRYYENPIRHSQWLLPPERRKRKKKPLSLTPGRWGIIGATAALAVVVAIVTIGYDDDAAAARAQALEAQATRGDNDSVGAAATAAPAAGANPGQSAAGRPSEALQQQIAEAIKATAWPALQPPMNVVIDGLIVDPQINCDAPVENPGPCKWGSDAASTRVVLVGDSVAQGYSGPLREIALNSNGKVQVYSLALGSCAFANDVLQRKGMKPADDCRGRNQAAVDIINATKPDVVIVSNRFKDERVVGTNEPLTPQQWADSLRGIVGRFVSNTKKVVFLSPPAGDAEIAKCFPKPGSMPSDCIGAVSSQWASIGDAEKALAAELSGTWIDSRPWFCGPTRTGEACPSFVGTTPTKRDMVHMTPAYGHKLVPVIAEALTSEGVLPPA